ncbi:uncharacterized protein TNCV_2029491 [Trichonephila clavipes]|nr:uncharacterized protein TNCV_2029491 [Trichonephila clavipes]
MSKQMVRRWCWQFSEGRQSVYDEERSGRPFLINDLVKLVRLRVIENCRSTITELSSPFPQISRSFLDEIVTKHLLSKKIVCQVDAENRDTRTENSTLRSSTDIYATVSR